ncbi:right-handed parallel beta-helix repeat-containing protein [Antarcticibacterium sp. 1MA-6-2]|uniref:right-handed parallel beta-helix repeat-containing protein n=1 Tax=Antarcticibacterium sp. 1MA-6-2 TaxID=2908210 RepID=UPI001F20F32F|nr:right-handed parallel beta-helix repeat-containing protein [Antarcticibacterium sp. 1MA-6-2]UJH91028.1 right-handed parallel beta-helix repeat-containing protein [Antarcticibacterium sp. 1MA-6-2]
MRHNYFVLSLLSILFFASCTPEFRGELDNMLHEASITYYISPSGNDSNSGNTPDDAWKSIEKINSLVLEPGSRIFFEGGSEFPGTLYLDQDDANDASHPVKISSYGNGKAKILAGNGFGINVYNTAGIKINNLIVEGSGMYTNQESGIQFYNDLPGNIKLENIEITNCEVYGFKIFGIVIGAWNQNSGFKDVLIENNKVHHCLDVGIGSYGHFSTTKTELCTLQYQRKELRSIRN